MQSRPLRQPSQSVPPGIQVYPRTVQSVGKATSSAQNMGQYHLMHDIMGLVHLVLTCLPCSKFTIARSVAYGGASARLLRVLKNAREGKPTKIGVLGGSVSHGHGVHPHQNWIALFENWWKTVRYGLSSDHPTLSQTNPNRHSPTQKRLSPTAQSLPQAPTTSPCVSLNI